MYTNRRAHRSATFPDFSMEIRRGSRGLITIVYASGSRHLTFEGELLGPNWKQINLIMPSDFPSADRPRVVEHLAAGMAELGYEYRILSRGAAEPVPESERQAALAEMRALGWEPQVSGDGVSVEMRRTNGTPTLTREEAEAQAQRFVALLRSAHGLRYKLADLARSSAAID